MDRDNQITEEVRKALLKNKAIDATEIGVRVKQGIVSLEGKVHTPDEKVLITKLTKAQSGVVAVRDHLQVNSESADLSGPMGVLKKDLGVGNY